MMPSPQMPNQMPPSAPPAGEGGAPDMKPMLIQVIKKVMDTCKNAGIDFEQLVKEASGGAMEQEDKLPLRPPSSLPQPA